MKKITLIIFLCILSTFSYSQKITFKDILNGISTTLNKMAIKPNGILMKEYVVNSTSNANLMGGHNRIAEQIILPPNTVKWYYRVTILDKKSNYQYPENETLLYCIQNGIEPRNFVNLNVPFNIFVLNSSGDTYNFTQGKPFGHLREYSVYNTQSYIGLCPLVTGNIWLGIQNASAFTGAKVIIEIVAMVMGG